MKDIGLKSNHWLIIGFCTLYILVQLAFIVKAHFSTDKRFGFWMFAETTLFSAELYRLKSDGSLRRAYKGAWSVRNDGKRTLYSWNNYVRDYRLNFLERERRAKGSMDRTLMFLQAALDYVADQIEGDRETVQLILEVHSSRAGGELEHLTLKSKERAI